MLQHVAGVPPEDVSRADAGRRLRQLPVDRERPADRPHSPPCPRRAIRYVGNAASLGAQLVSGVRARARAGPRRSRGAIEHVSLAAHPDFEDIFVDCMNFPRRDAPATRRANRRDDPAEPRRRRRWARLHDDRRALADGLRGRARRDRRRATSTRSPTTAPLAHPALPRVLRVAARGRAAGPRRPRGIALRGVHATHDLRLHRLPRAGDALTHARPVVAVAPRRAGRARRQPLRDRRRRRATGAARPTTGRSIAASCDRSVPRRACRAADRGDAGPVPGAGPAAAMDAATRWSRRDGRRRARPRVHRVRADLESHPHRPRGRPVAPACPASSCTARRRSPWPCRAALAARPDGDPPRGVARIARPLHGRWCPCPRRLTVRGIAEAAAAGERPARIRRCVACRRRARPPRRECRAGPHEAEARPDKRADRGRAEAASPPTGRPTPSGVTSPTSTARRPALAQATLRFHEHYGSDFLKVTPAGGYAVEAWGCVEGDEVAPDGHRPCARCAVTTPDDWKKIRAARPESTAGARSSRRSSAAASIAAATPRAADHLLPALAGAKAVRRAASTYDLREHPQAGHGRPRGDHRDDPDPFAERAAHRGRRRASSTRSRRRAATATPRRSTRGSASPTTGASSRRSAEVDADHPPLPRRRA